MDVQNNSECDSSEVFPTEGYGKVLDISTGKYSYNVNAIYSNMSDNSYEKRINYNSSLHNKTTTTFHCEDNKESIILDILKIQENIFPTDSNNVSSVSCAEDKTDNFDATTKESIPPPVIIKTEPPDDFQFSGDSNFEETLLNGTIKQEESREMPAVESGDDVCHQDTRRTRRFSKRKREEECCPVCGISLRVPELENHYKKEIENLSKISKNVRKNRSEEKSISTTFVQVKSNRENRLSAKVTRYSARAKNEVQCPVCSLRMTGLQEEINKHVANCINEDENSNEIVVVDDEDSHEEYEFADQTRVRAISFVPGGYRALQGDSSRNKPTEEDDLNVDVEDTLTYGEAQYTELDVIHNTNDISEVKELEELRKAVMLDSTVQPHVLKSRKWHQDYEEIESSEQPSSAIEEKLLDSKEKTKEVNKQNKEAAENIPSNHVIASLQEKIKDLEEQNRNVKCLICLEPYTKPVVSTSCWHVYCEECWLMTMGVKKLCPQCNMIVFPSDLRRIYL